jgi:SAM-dependent methyltransferase
MGARVHLVETDARDIPNWRQWRVELGVEVDWQITDSERLPFSDQSMDVVTSYSVIEHQASKQRAIEEVARVLKPGGLLAISFDVCEPELGMSYPPEYGRALSMREFEDLVWRHEAFDSARDLDWNVGDIPEFLQWHRKGNPAHNYTVGAAILRKRM